MSEHRIRLVTDNDTVIELTITERGKKIMLEYEERSLPEDSSAETASAVPVSPESPGATLGADA